MKRPAIDIAGKTDKGCVRERNEDSLAVDPAIGLLVVADGMGGHSSGEVASRLAVDTILEYGRKMVGGEKLIVPEGGRESLPIRLRQLEYIVQIANTMIFEKARAFPKNHGMGTTVVAVLADEKSLGVAHVGDSRLYLYRAQSLQQLTEDHSLVMDQVRQGVITKEQAEKSNLQNILTRALGTEEKVEVDVAEHPFFAGDILLLCSDGLTKMVPEGEIAGMLKASATSAEAADRLVEAAREAGGADNITAVVAKALAGPSMGLKGFLWRLFEK
ncbi:MAG: Stp1/IreP family PP2C-type Ser/Thr phosphatase [Elusimicrobia bacterium]|nr:Stp1/IreP family PP2C-type Ser/Thr phosphatase [Elusimicrobiota bacterium]